MDIKPSNVIISGGDAYLIDFGSALRLKDRKSAYSASRGYAAPEQTQGRTVGCSTDIYSLGKLLEYLLEHGKTSAKTGRKLRRIAMLCEKISHRSRISSVGILIQMLEKLRDRETEKINLQKRGLNNQSQTRRIGVLGMNPGDGVTHISIALANYLADYCYQNVCLVEESDHNDIVHMLELYTKESFDRKGPANYRGVRYVTSGFIGECESEKTEYDSVVYDFGCNAKRAAGKLAECDLCIVVTGAAPWRLKKIEKEMSSGVLKTLAKDTVVLINEAEEKQIKAFRDFGIRVLAYPFDGGFIDLKQQTVKILEKAIM